MATERTVMAQTPPVDIWSNVLSNSVYDWYDRKTMDPKQVVLEDEVHKMENEYDLAQKVVDEVDTLYWDIKKNEYHKTWMPTL